MCREGFPCSVPACTRVQGHSSFSQLFLDVTPSAPPLSTTLQAKAVVDTLNTDTSFPLCDFSAPAAPAGNKWWT